MASSPGGPREWQPPMGRVQDTNEGEPSASRCGAAGRRLGWRTCLRKGCGRSFRARQWNQRYCGAPECQREVRRWQATRRQRARRASAEGREKHAEAERARRQRSAEQSKPAADGDSASAIRAGPGAWSRSETPLPRVVCDRPGCYEPPRDSRRTPASYCSDACREAMRRVRSPGAQVFGPQDESRPTEASPGVCRRGQEATGPGIYEPRRSTAGSDGRRPCGRKNRGRRLWAGRSVWSTFAAIFGGCRA